MAGQANHDFHMVNPSPWPALGGLSALVLGVGLVFLMHDQPLLGLSGPVKLVPGFILLILTMVFWWRDVIKESVSEKAHTKRVTIGLRQGMVLFIASEVMFFFAFFWAFFHHALGFSYSAPVWPPEGITVFNPWTLPFYNTVILLTSGATVTRAHLYMEENKFKEAATWLWVTVGLGVFFLGVQIYEYGHAAFGLSDGIYPSTFFLATGFHGFHVFVGTVFLIVCAMRAQSGAYNKDKHVGFESAAWYWHFVDVVWLFLFVWVYWLLAGDAPMIG